MADTRGSSFELFTSLRYDPILLESAANSSDLVSFSSPSPFYMLKFHRDRMLEAARFFEWQDVQEKLADGAALERELSDAITRYEEQAGKKQPLKIRILFTKAGEMKVEPTPVEATTLETLYPSSLPAPAIEPAFKPSPLTGGALKRGPHDVSHLPVSTWILHVDSEATPSTAYTSLKTTHRSHYNASRTRALPPADKSDGRTHEVLLFNDANEMTEGSLTSLYFWRSGKWVTPPVGNTPAALLQAISGDAQSKPTESSNIQDVARQAASDSSSNTFEHDGDRLPSFGGRWGHSLRASSKYPDSGGQRGTTRRWALKMGLCMEETVERPSVRPRDTVWVSNGVRGFVEGRVVA